MTTTTTPAHLILCELADASADGVESYSPFCLKVHRTLRALGLPYERRAGRPDSYAEYNPAKQVPVLLVDGAPFADSTNILAELDRLTDGGLYVRRDGRVHPEERLYEELADVSLNGFLVAARWIDAANSRASASRPASARQCAAIARMCTCAFGRAAAFSAQSAASSWRCKRISPIARAPIIANSSGSKGLSSRDWSDSAIASRASPDCE